TQEQLSERVGKKRTTVANYLRLLKLPAEVQIGLRDKTIDMGHARALLSVENATVQLELYKAIVTEGLSVRKVEELARAMAQAPAKAATKVARSSAQRKEYNLLRNHLSNFFGTKVQFSCNDKGKGKISIPFKNEEELERIVGLLDKLK
ncbi:MAG: chromosome partitioning protein ParB, partial [Bacteroidaceae bacterium]|nr:chromosome partitioning protein ParB [Bacteroidaceae bacterium]